MSDLEKAVDYITRFLNDPTKRTLLIKGYDNDAKLKASLVALNEIFKNGIIKTSSMGSFSRHFWDAFNKDVLPRQVKSTSIYKVGKMNLSISSYVTHTKNNYYGNENTFSLFYPVQTVLDNENKYIKLREEIANTESKKILILTTNEWSIKNWDIENRVDDIFFFDVESDNPNLMSNLRNNGAI
ncbi:hypothetical protein ACQUEF_03590 [Vagococcus fluvialis]|uniref:hypothetical protein n=1 Tax=Vagococcus fluvialis TaxID=2738 RepID=UPI003D13230B